MDHAATVELERALDGHDHSMTTTPHVSEATAHLPLSDEPPILQGPSDDTEPVKMHQSDKPRIPIGPPSDPDEDELLSDPAKAARRETFVPETFG